MDPVVLFSKGTARGCEVMSAVSRDQLGLPTPCTEWDMRAVISHMIAGSSMVLVFAGLHPLLDPAADQVGDDPSTAFAEA